MIFWGWANLTHNSFSFLLKDTLLGFCCNVNWEVVKTIKITNYTTFLPSLHTQFSSRDFLRNYRPCQEGFYFRITIDIIFPMDVISLFNTTAALFCSMLIIFPQSRINSCELKNKVITRASSINENSS